MDLLNEIRTGFANLNEQGGMLRITVLEESFSAWIFREDSMFGVAVEISDDHRISERFAGAKLVTVERLLGESRHHLLRLESSRLSLRNEFAVICAQMVTPGVDGASRRTLLADPLGWWEKWRQLLGNAIVNQSAYSVLGEMLALERLLELGMAPDWKGGSGATVDIETPNAGYEVKSTISRYESRVHIAGQFQLATSTTKILNLVHQRFEPSPTGDSIDIVVDRLVAFGKKRDVLEQLLTRCGLEAGCAARMEKYKLLDSQLFKIDENFPKITLENFVGGTLPVGIVHIEYQVDLTGLAHSSF